MVIKQKTPRLSLFPATVEVNEKGRLIIGVCDTVELAEEFGTPLYIFDESDLRGKCTEFINVFGEYYPGTAVAYACKTFMNKALALLLKEEGLGLDVVSGGEMNIAHSVDFPLDRVYFHGNNKSAEELKLALEWKVGRIVLDNFYEMAMLSEIAKEKGCVVDVLMRITPGVDPHTHKYITTGTVDSKFGFPLSAGEEAIAKVMSAPNLNLVGLHFHLGSQVFGVEPYLEAIGLMLDLAAVMKRKNGFELEELDIGGGFALQYTVDEPSPPVSFYAEKIASTIIGKCQELNLKLPQLVIEPGRAIVGRAGVALYRIGAIKDIPGVRRYVSVDGGMADNIRPALYDAKYEAVVANKMLAKETDLVTVAGKFCESGDILIRDIKLPRVTAGDVLAVPGCGAYCLAQASNYNASLKVAVVLVKDGKARLIRRRETYEDLTRGDVV